jgi:hypothetical protein
LEQDLHDGRKLVCHGGLIYVMLGRLNYAVVRHRECHRRDKFAGLERGRRFRGFSAITKPCKMKKKTESST